MSPEGAVAVTGAGGYLGGVISRALERAGVRVCRFSRTPASSGDVGFRLAEPLPEREFSSRKISALVHCAYDFRPRGWRDIRRVNVEGALGLLETARRAGVRRIIFLSSLSAFEGCASLYGRGKLEVERKVLELGGAVLRPGTVYGPRPGGVMGAILGRAFSGSWSPVLKHPGPLFLSHEEDVSSAVAALLDGPPPGRPVFAAHPRPWSLEGIVRAVAGFHGKSVRTLSVPWRAAWLALKAAELLGARPAFRSDSVLSLGLPIPSSEIEKLSPPAVPFREFNPGDLPPPP